VAESTSVDEMTGKPAPCFFIRVVRGICLPGVTHDSHIPRDSHTDGGKGPRTRGQAFFESAVQDGLTREGIKALAIVPIVHEGRLIACVNVASHTHEEVPSNPNAGSSRRLPRNVGLAYRTPTDAGSTPLFRGFFFPRKAFEDRTGHDVTHVAGSWRQVS